MRGVLCFCCLVTLVFSQGNDALVRLERSATKARYFAGERMTVTTRVLIQAEVSLRQLFGRRVDIPVELLMPVGFEFAAVSDAQRVTMVVNGQAVSARRLDQQVIDGESFDVYELAASRVVQVEGEMLLPSITVRGERVLSFREDFFEGRVPDKTVVFEAQAPELSLEVVPLPTAPPGSDFRGAMDVRSVVFELLPTESTDADIFMVALSVTLGSIGGSFGDAPLASDFGDFTIVEQRSETVGLTRKHVLQLRRAVSEALSIGPVMVCCFNPRGEGFFELLLTESVAVPGGSSESEAEGAKGWMRVGSLSSEDVSRAPTLEFVMGLLMVKTRFSIALVLI